MLSDRTHDSLITFNNGLGTLKTKSGRGVSRDWVGWGDVLGGDFVLRGPNPFFKKTLSNCHVSDISWLSRVV